MFGAVQTANAQTEQKETIKFGKQKKFSRSKLTVKFVSVVEDSRCPQDVQCVQAGNARIKVEISNGTTKEIFEMNTTLGPKGASFSGFAIYLDELMPMTKQQENPTKRLQRQIPHRPSDTVIFSHEQIQKDTKKIELFRVLSCLFVAKLKLFPRVHNFFNRFRVFRDFRS